MDGMIETMYSNYLSGEFKKIVPEYKSGEAENKFDELWENLNNGLPNDECVRNCEIMCDAVYESDKRTFRDAFRLGFLLCAEVFLRE